MLFKLDYSSKLSFPFSIKKKTKNTIPQPCGVRIPPQRCTTASLRSCAPLPRALSTHLSAQQTAEGIQNPGQDFTSTSLNILNFRGWSNSPLWPSQPSL